MRLSSVLLSACVFAAMFLTGCAAGRVVDYHGTSDFAVPTAKGARVVIGASDERPYVFNGDKQANFVGLSRSAYGIPFGVLTKSGEPLSDEIGGLVAGALRKSGATVTQIKIPVGTPADKRSALFKAANSHRSYLIEIREWLTDTYVNVALKYDVALSVLDSRGSQLATKSAKGEDKLGSRPDRANLAVALSSIFGDLFNDSEIVKAAGSSEDSPQNTASPAQVKTVQDEKPNACTVDQILEMKKLGLSEERIKVACK